MTIELGPAIAAVLGAAGEGIARLRESGAMIEIRDCSIEVVIEDPDPVAHVRFSLGQPVERQPENTTASG